MMEIGIPWRMRELRQRILTQLGVTVLQVGEEAERVCFEELLLVAESHGVVEEGARMELDGERPAATFTDEELAVHAWRFIFLEETRHHLG